SDGQPLSLAPRNARGQSVRGDAPAQWGLHPTFQSPVWPRRACFSGAFQSHPSRARELSVGGLSLCRAQPGAGKSRETPRSVSMEQLACNGRAGPGARMAESGVDAGAIQRAALSGRAALSAVCRKRGQVLIHEIKATTLHAWLALCGWNTQERFT